MMYFTKRKKYLVPLLFLAAIAVISFVVMLLWNAVIPDVFKLPEISYRQAFLLLILSRLLFGTGHFRHPGSSHFSIHDRLKEMSPEEREELKKNWGRFRQAHEQCHPYAEKESTGNKSGPG